MKTYQCVQYSPDWWQLRAGIPTASMFDKIITPAKWGKSASARGYICELAAELAGYHTPNFFTERENRPKSYAMAYGTNTEPEARRYYELQREARVQQVGFCLSDCGRYGCSPDGLILESPDGIGGLELKCPEAKTHIGYLLDGTLPTEYKPQVEGCLLVTGAPWWDFMSYVPHLDPFLIRVYPNKDTARLKEVLEEFLAEHEAILARLGLTENRKAADEHRRRAA